MGLSLGFLSCSISLYFCFCASTKRASLIAQLVKNPPCNSGDPGSIPGSGRSPGEGKVYPLQYSDLESSMDCIVHGVTKSWTQLSHFHIHIYIFKTADVNAACIETCYVAPPPTHFKEVFDSAASPIRVGQQGAHLPEVILSIGQAYI